MVFTNAKEEKVTYFKDLNCGDYFRLDGNFYIKTSLFDDDEDYYALNLETGVMFTFCSEMVEPINIKEIMYENK